jgi:hypothetical protein
MTPVQIFLFPNRNSPIHLTVVIIVEKLKEAILKKFIQEYTRMMF